MTPELKKLSDEAIQASDNAGYGLAPKLHQLAADLHLKAATAFSKTGDSTRANYHGRAHRDHLKMMVPTT